MDRWSTAAIAPQTVHVTQSKPLGKAVGAPSNERQLPTGAPAQEIAMVRLNHVLGVMRRLGKAEEKSQRVMQFLTALSSEENRSGASGRTTVAPLSTDAVCTSNDTAVLSTHVVPPSTASLWRAVETAFSSAVETWLSEQLGGDATMTHQHETTDAIEDASLEGERSLACGVALSLSHVPLQAEHLPLLVEYLDAASAAPFLPMNSRDTQSPSASVATSPSRDSLAHAKGRSTNPPRGGKTSSCRACVPRALLAQGRIPLRSVDLTGLVSTASVSQRVFQHLVDLVRRVDTILVLHVSHDTYLLTQKQCDALSQALAGNLERCQRRARAERRGQRKEERRRAQHERDDTMNFYFWENAERCALMELEHRMRRDIRSSMREAERTTLKKAQEAFTRSRLAAERMEFFRFASDSLRDFYAQSLSALIRQQLKFLQQQESRSRSQVVGAMSSALDRLVMDRKAEVARLHERAKTATAARKDVTLALLRDERAGRAAVAGEYTALAIASVMWLWLRFRGRPTIANSMRVLYLGPMLYRSKWSLRHSEPQAEGNPLERDESLSPSPLRARGAAEPQPSFRDLTLHRNSSSLHNLGDVASAALRSSKPLASPAGVSGVSSGSFRSTRAASPNTAGPLAATTSPTSSKRFSPARSSSPSGGGSASGDAALAVAEVSRTLEPTTHDDDLPAPEE